MCRIGRDPEDSKEKRILNRIPRLTEAGLRFEADPRHGELLARSLGIETSPGVAAPGVKIPLDIHGDKPTTEEEE